MRKLRTIEMQRLTPEEFQKAEKLPLTVVLDDVRSMHNVGSVLRTADAFRLEEVVLCGITGTPPHPRFTRQRWVPRTACRGAIATQRSRPYSS